MQIICGVPQGSINGRKLFLLFINDICNVSSDIKYIFHADDTRISILCSSNNIKKLCNTMNKNLEELQTWFIANKLSLSIEKTNYMIFSNKAIDKSDIIIKIDQELTKQVMTTKFFGVMIDSHSQWEEHIICVNLKTSICITIIYDLREIFTANTMKQLRNSFLFPYIDYYLEVFGRTYPSNVNPVYAMQEKAIRIIFDAQYNEHTNNYFIQLNALKLFDLLKYKTGFSMHTANKNLLPKVFKILVCMLLVCILVCIVCILLCYLSSFRLKRSIFVNHFI